MQLPLSPSLPMLLEEDYEINAQWGEGEAAATKQEENRTITDNGNPNYDYGKVGAKMLVPSAADSCDLTFVASPGSSGNDNITVQDFESLRVVGGLL